MLASEGMACLRWHPRASSCHLLASAHGLMVRVWDTRTGKSSLFIIIIVIIVIIIIVISISIIIIIIIVIIIIIIIINIIIIIIIIIITCTGKTLSSFTHQSAVNEVLNFP